MSQPERTGEPVRHPGTGARVLLFLLALAGSWVLLFLGFPPGVPDRLPVLAIALGLALWTAARPDLGIVAFCFLFPCTGLLVRLFGGTDPSTWPALLFGGVAVGWTFRFIYDFESLPERSAVDRPLRALLVVWLLATVLAVCRARTLWAIGHGLAGRAVNGQGLEDVEAIRESAFAFSALLSGACLFFLVRHAGPRLRERAVGAALWGASASAVASVLQRLGVLAPETRGFWKLTGRLAGGAVDPNSLGLLCALMLVVALTRAVATGKRGGLEAGRVALLVAGLLLSGSRSGLLLLVLSLALLLTGPGLPRRARVAGVALFASVLVVLALLVARATPGTLGGRLAETFDPNLPLEYRVSARPVLWRAAARLALSRPVEGEGMGTFAWRFPDLMKEEKRRFPMRDNPGSAYLQALAETGVLGFLLTIGFVASLARQAAARWRGPASDGVAASAGVVLIAFLLAMVFGSHWFAPDVSLLFFLLASTVVGSDDAAPPRRGTVAGRAAVLVYGVAALAGMLGTVRPEETFRYSSRIGFHAPEPGSGNRLRWTRRRFALWLAPGESRRLHLAHFTPEPKPVDVEAALDGRIVWRQALAPGEAVHLLLAGSSQHPRAFVFRVSRAFVPRRLRLSDDRRELGLLSSED
jgi:O-antigen ligase